MNPISSSGSPYHQSSLTSTPQDEIQKAVNALDILLSDYYSQAIQPSDVQACVNTLSTIVNDRNMPQNIRDQANSILQELNGGDFFSDIPSFFNTAAAWHLR